MDFLTIPEIASSLGVPYISAYKLATSGAFGESIRAGKMHLLPRAQASAAIAAYKRSR